MRRLLIFPLVLTLLACVSCSSAMESTSAPPMARADEEAPMEESAYAAVDMVVGQMPGQAEKKIKNGSMEMETDELDFTVNEIERTVLAYGGYIESKSATTRAGASGEDFRYANLLARVPAENYEKLTEYAMGLGTVLDFYDSVTDMSSEYADIQSKLNVKKLEEERLLAFIEESTQIGDRIELEKRLGEVRGDIDLYETNMQSIDRKVDFSSLNINISETGSPAIRPLNANLGERAREGVKASFDSAFMLLQNIVVFMAYVSVPTILIIVSLGAGALVYRKAGKKKE